MPQTEIRGDSLEKLIKEAEKLPGKPTGTICNLFRTDKASPGGDGYSRTVKLREGLYVQCFGECKERGKKCEPVIDFIRASDEPPEFSWIVLKCLCREPRGKIHVD